MPSLDGRKQRAKKSPTRPAAASSPAPSAAVKAESKPLERREAQARAVQDIGEHSNGENTRLRVRVEELENQKRLLEFENIGLKSELRDSVSGAVRGRYVGWLRQLTKSERIDEIKKLIAEADLYEHEMPDIPVLGMRPAVGGRERCARPKV
jgi:hypothetical protein